MLSATNFWMSFAGLIYLVVGVFILRKQISAARGWDKLITLGCVFIAVSLAVFAPEHFHGGPEYIQSMAPPWMPARWFWPYFVGSALLAAATSLTVGKFVRWSSTLLGLMFFLFVCMIYAPSALAHPKSRFAWIFALRDLSFAGGAWALAGLHNRASSPQAAKWMILFGRIVLAIAAIFYGVQHFLHPQFAPGVPLDLKMPSWVPFPGVWEYLAGAILLAAGVGLALNKKPRIAAASIGGLMTVLTLFLYLVILILAHGVSEINEALNYVADTLLYAGAALALASALPYDPDRVGQAGEMNRGNAGRVERTDQPRSPSPEGLMRSSARRNQTAAS
jgi:uncharacterized membrane protein YphA (DoxX/SURF4 family)